MRDAGINRLPVDKIAAMNRMRVALLNCRQYINEGAPVSGSSVENMHKAEERLSNLNAQIDEALK